MVEGEDHVTSDSIHFKILKKMVNPSCLILNYGNFRGARHLQYTNPQDMQNTNDDTIWHSQDYIYNDLINGKARVEGIS